MIKKKTLRKGLRVVMRITVRLVLGMRRLTIRAVSRLKEAIWGKRYYAIIVGERGSDRYDLTSEIHATKASVLAHRRRIEGTVAYEYIETISFRARRMYHITGE